MTYLTRTALAEIEEERETAIRLEEEEIYPQLLAEHEATSFYDFDDEELDYVLLPERAHALAVARCS